MKPALEQRLEHHNKILVTMLIESHNYLANHGIKSNREYHRQKVQKIKEEYKDLINSQDTERLSYTKANNTSRPDTSYIHLPDSYEAWIKWRKNEKM